MANRKRKWPKIVIPLALILAAIVYFVMRPGSGTKYTEAVASVGNISTTYSFTGNITAPPEADPYIPRQRNRKGSLCRRQ